MALTAAEQKELDSLELRDLELRDKELELKEKELTSRPKKSSSFLGGVGRAALEGATYGAGPFIEAGLRSLSGPESFQDELQAITEEQGQFEKENPGVALLADIGGSLATGGAVARTLTKAGVKAGTKAVVGAAAAEGALRAGSRGQDPVAGALAGGGLGVFGQKIAPAALNKIARLTAPLGARIKAFSNKLSFKSLGGTATEFRDRRKIGEIGKTLRDKKVVTPFASKNKILDRLVGDTDIPDKETMDILKSAGVDVHDYASGGIIKQYADEVSEAIDKMDGIYLDVVGEPVQIPSEIIFKNLVGKNLDQIKTNSAVAPMSDFRSRIGVWKDFLGLGDDGTPKVFTLKELHDFKKNLGRRIHSKNFRLEPFEHRAALPDLYREIKNFIEEGLDYLTPNQKLGTNLVKKLNEENSKLIDAANIAIGGAAREEARLPVGLYGIAAGATLGGTYSASQGESPFAGAAQGALAIEFGRRYGYPILATAFDQVSKFMLPRTTEGLISNKEMVIAKLLASGAPSVAQRFSQVVDKDPARISALGPYLIELLANEFAPSAYASEFDGRLFNDQDKKNYAEQVMRARTISNTEKAKILNNLNLNGAIVDLSGGGNVPEETLMKKAMEKKQEVLELPPMDIYAE